MCIGDKVAKVQLHEKASMIYHAVVLSYGATIWYPGPAVVSLLFCFSVSASAGPCDCCHVHIKGLPSDL